LDKSIESRWILLKRATSGNTDARPLHFITVCRQGERLHRWSEDAWQQMSRWQRIKAVLRGE
jgi:hypothetical protein